MGLKNKERKSPRLCLDYKVKLMNQQKLREEIERILIPADYHSETHENIPVAKWSYNRQGIEFVIDELVKLFQRNNREEMNYEN